MVFSGYSDVRLFKCKDIKGDTEKQTQPRFSQHIIIFSLEMNKTFLFTTAV